MRKIINIGTYPPPYGGVSIHLKMLRQHLQNNHIPNELIDCSCKHKRRKEKDGIKVMRWTIAIIYLFFHKRAILHFHNFSWNTSLAYYMLALRHAIIVSFHNERFLMEIEKPPNIIRKIIIKSINSADVIIADNEKCRALAEMIITDKSKIFVIPEFIPPSKIPRIDRHHSIMQMRKKHKCLLSSNAWQISFHNNTDLYGIDMLIELVAHLCNENMDIALVFLLPQIGNQSYYLRLKKQITRQNISDRFLFATEPLEQASSLWRISDLFVRATNTDGNSHSILEALSVGTPVLASDCTQRPEGVILFKTRDFHSLYKKTKEILFDIHRIQKQVKKLRVENNAYKIIGIYDSLKQENT